MTGELEGYCFLVDPADPFDPHEWTLVPMADLRPGDLFGLISESDARLALLMDESAPDPARQGALAGMVRDAPRFRFVRDNDQGDGRVRCRATPIEDWRASLAEPTA